jgi:Holliday junction DNA helicase RuvB
MELEVDDGYRRIIQEVQDAYWQGRIKNDPNPLELEDYPTSWKTFTGQKLAVSTLRMAAESSRKRGKAMNHVLLANATPGVGKTALALLVARELKAKIKMVSGRVGPTEAQNLLLRLSDGDVFFIDEMHQMGKNSQWLLHYMQDGVLVGVRGITSVPKVTIIGATTDVSLLPAPLISRFQIRPILMPYTISEAARMAQIMAKGVLQPEGWPKLNNEQAHVIATAANCNPRVIRRLLLTLLDAVTTTGLNPDGSFPLGIALGANGLDPDGMSLLSWEYLEILDREFAGTAGAESIAERLSVAGGNVPEIEAVLLDKGYVVRRPNGRTLSDSGLRALTAKRSGN